MRSSVGIAEGIPLALRRRELLRRRWLLLTMALLILLSTSPVVGHHVVRAVDWLPMTLQHVGAFCMVALHQLLAPVHGAFHVALAAGAILAVADRLRALRRAHRTLGGTLAQGVREGDGVFEAAMHAGVSPSAVRIVHGSPVPAFTAGLIVPRIYVSSDLPRRLRREEVAAVLAHEAVHLARRDPLRLSAWRFLAVLLFWLPALRRVADDLADEAEIEADSQAAQRYPLELASALVTLAGGPRTMPASELGGAGLQSYDLLPRRVQRLAGLQPPVESRVSATSLLSAAVVLAFAWMSGVMVLHPLPPMAHTEATDSHCMHHEGGPWRHLLCRGGGWQWRDGPCPHTV